VLEPILESIKLQKPLACDEDQCKVAVSVLDPSTQTLGLCNALSLGHELGPPTKCEAVAVRNGSEWWLKVIDSANIVFPAMQAVYIFDIRGLPRSAILASIDSSLSIDPLVMTDRTVKEDRVMAIAPRRFSHVLSGSWFEWPQVLIEVDGEYKVTVSLDLLVNKQNSTDPVDWHLPTDPQQEEYRKALSGVVTQALAKICIDPVWKGSNALTCTMLRTLDGAVVRTPNRDGYLQDPRVTRLPKSHSD